MQGAPLISTVAALLGDPARANMLTALMDGRALAVSELAKVAGVALPTASGHLAKLESAGLLVAEKQGRHRYLRLSGADVAAVLEGLMALAQRTGARPARTGPRDAALRRSRICYDHIAGERGVALLRGLIGDGWLEDGEGLSLTGAGRDRLKDLGFDLEPIERGRRPLCRPCLDWSERRGHLAGALGASILSHVLDKGWARREAGRVLAFSAPGERAFARAFAVPAPDVVHRSLG